MTAEIMETKLERKKHEISCMVDDAKSLKKSSLILKELGYDNSDIEQIIKDISKDIHESSREAVRMRNAIERIFEQEELERKINDKNRSNK
jgi:Holliday junction resolvasome RuvABC DNA-binding subunit